jgi:hypothetical protein
MLGGLAITMSNRRVIVVEVVALVPDGSLSNASRAIHFERLNLSIRKQTVERKS